MISFVEGAPKETDGAGVPAAVGVVDGSAASVITVLPNENDGLVGGGPMAVESAGASVSFSVRTLSSVTGFVPPKLNVDVTGALPSVAGALSLVEAAHGVAPKENPPVVAGFSSVLALDWVPKVNDGILDVAGFLAGSSLLSFAKEKPEPAGAVAVVDPNENPPSPIKPLAAAGSGAAAPPLAPGRGY